MAGLVHASTSLLRSHSQFLRFVSRLQGICKSSQVLLYSLSHNAPELEQSVRRLSSCTEETIGCLSGPMSFKKEQPFFSCSVALFDGDSCQPFSSLKTGGGPVQVGRWHAFRKKEIDPVFNGPGGQGMDEDIDWKELWNTKSSARFLPQELKDVTDARSLIYFSDNSSWELASALHEHLPQSRQLGVVASSTPFVTGHPFTLLRNGKAQPSGAVGIAWSAPPLENVLRFDGLVQLTRPLPVRRAEGNLIHELGDSLPARILLKAIQGHGLPDDQAKDVDYYIGTRDASEGERVSPRLLRIVAGSPSRGSIAVEEVAAPPAGSLVEFYYRPKSSPIQLPPEVLRKETGSPSALFSVLVDSLESNYSGSSDSTLFPETSVHGDDLQKTYESSFVVSTEHGFVLSSVPQGSTFAPWKCTVPGTFGGLRFSSKSQ